MSQRTMLPRDSPSKTVDALQAKVLKWWFRCTGARLLLLEKLLRARLPLRRAFHNRASHCTPLRSR